MKTPFAVFVSEHSKHFMFVIGATEVSSIRRRGNQPRAVDEFRNLVKLGRARMFKRDKYCHPAISQNRSRFRSYFLDKESKSDFCKAYFKDFKSEFVSYDTKKEVTEKLRDFLEKGYKLLGIWDGYDLEITSKYESLIDEFNRKNKEKVEFEISGDPKDNSNITIVTDKLTGFYNITVWTDTKRYKYISNVLEGKETYLINYFKLIAIKKFFGFNVSRTNAVKEWVKDNISKMRDGKFENIAVKNFSFAPGVETKIILDKMFEVIDELGYNKLQGFSVVYDTHKSKVSQIISERMSLYDIDEEATGDDEINVSLNNLLKCKSMSKAKFDITKSTDFSGVRDTSYKRPSNSSDE